MAGSAPGELEPKQTGNSPTGESPPSIAQQLGFVAGTVTGVKDELASALNDITNQVNDALGLDPAKQAEPTKVSGERGNLSTSSRTQIQIPVYERSREQKPNITVTTQDQGGGLDVSTILDFTLGPQVRLAKGIAAAAATAAAGITLLQQKAIDESKNGSPTAVSRRQALRWLAGISGTSAAAGVVAACAPTRAPEKTGSPSPIASTVIGELTPQARNMVRDYNNSLVQYLQTEFPDTKGVGGFPILNFVDARVDSNNPAVISVFSNQPGINKIPTEKDLSFVIGGKMFIATRDSKTGQRIIYPVSRPDVSYSSIRYNIERNQLEYLDSFAKPVAHITITGDTISELTSDIPATATPAPTKTNTPPPSPTETSTVTPSPTATVAPSPAPTREPTAAPTPTDVPNWWTSEDISVKEAGINEWASRVHIESNEADQTKLREVFRLLKFVKNQHTLPDWAKFPFSIDNPLKFLKNVTYIHMNRGERPYAYGGGAINLNPTFLNYMHYSEETLWILQAGWAMKEASYNTWFKEARRSAKGDDSYTDWVTTWAAVFTMQDIYDANGGKKWVANGQKVGEEVAIMIDGYTSLLNNKAAERGWK